MAHWYCKTVRGEQGPLTSAQLLKLSQLGRIRRVDLVRKGDHGKWVPAAHVKGLFPKDAQDDETTNDEKTNDEKTNDEAAPQQAEPGDSNEPADADTSSRSPALLRNSLLILAGAAACLILATLPWIFSSPDTPQRQAALAPSPISAGAEVAVVEPSSAVADVEPEPAKVATVVVEGEVQESQGAPATEEANDSLHGEAAPIEAEPAAADVDAAVKKESASPPDSNEISESEAPSEDPPQPAEETAPSPSPDVEAVGASEKAAESPEDAAAVEDETQRREQERQQRLQEIEKERLDLVNERNALEAKMVQKQQQLAAAQAQGQQMQAQMAALNAEIEKTQNRIAALSFRDASSVEVQTQLAISRQDLNRYLQQRRVGGAQLTSALKQFGAMKSEMENLIGERQHLQQLADKLRDEWLELMDPFGKLGRGQSEQAVAAFTRWIEIEPQLALTYLARGFALLHAGDPEAAIDDFDKAGETDAGLVALAYCGRGLAMAEMGKERDSQRQFRRAINLDQQRVKQQDDRNVKAHPWPFVFRGLGRSKAGSYTLALNDFENAINLDEEDPAAYREAAWLLATCAHASHRNADKAIRYATKACELTDWKDWSSLAALAAAHAEARNFEEAVKYGNQVSSLVPSELRPEHVRHLQIYKSGKVFPFQ